MDPQNQLSGLDPKLKEAYERVMGTTIPPASTPASPPPAPPQEPAASAPTSQTEPVPPPANQPSEPAPEQPPPPPVAPPQPPEPATPPLQQPELPPTPPVQPAESPPKPHTQQPGHIATGFVAASGAKEGKKGVGFKLSPPLMIVISIVFLLLYIFFWIRVFNLSLF